MARVIWKFAIAIRGITPIQIPADSESPPSRPLAVLTGLDPATGGPALWVELDPEADRVERRYQIRATGEKIAEDETHVGSLIDRGFVWHIYELHGQ